MARRRRIHEPASAHLLRAAAAHARITGRGEEEAEPELEREPAEEPNQQAHHARAQRRNEEGKFA